MNVYIRRTEHVKKDVIKTFILAPQWTSFQHLQRSCLLDVNLPSGEILIRYNFFSKKKHN